LIKHFEEFQKFVDKTKMANTTSQKIEKAREQLVMSKSYGFKIGWEVNVVRQSETPNSALDMESGP
jgi:hypothetical protein